MHWGGGFQVGLFYKTGGNWDFGASLKSKQWFEKLKFGTVNELGIRRNDNVDFQLPLVASAGLAYTGFERWLLAADVHYFDFDSAAGFRQKGFDATGAVRGVGFESIFGLNAGAQYLLTDRASVRLGYSFNENPIADSQSAFNVASPTIIMHTLYFGASYRLSDALTLSAAYAHGFENSVSGPFVTPGGAISDSSVGNTVSVDTFLIGAGMRL
jgi:long-chain fatty acid transport protein